MSSEWGIVQPSQQYLFDWKYIQRLDPIIFDVIVHAGCWHPLPSFLVFLLPPDQLSLLPMPQGKKAPIANSSSRAPSGCKQAQEGKLEAAKDLYTYPDMGHDCSIMIAHSLFTWDLCCSFELRPSLRAPFPLLMGWSERERESKMKMWTKGGILVDIICLLLLLLCKSIVVLSLVICFFSNWRVVKAFTCPAPSSGRTPVMGTFFTWPGEMILYTMEIRSLSDWARTIVRGQCGSVCSLHFSPHTLVRVSQSSMW